MAESELDQFFGPKFQVVQQSFFYEPAVPVEVLLEGLRPHIKEDLINLAIEKEDTLFVTSISAIEKIYPWLLKRLGIRSDIEIQQSPRDENSEAGIVGTKLHEADTLFAILVQVINENVQPWEIGTLLPTSSDEQVYAYQHAIDGIELRELVDEKQVYEAFCLAWRTYLKAGGFVETANRPMFDSFGLFDPFLQEDIIYSQKMIEYGERLARAWASALFFTQPIDSWEFHRHALTQREVSVVMNLDCGIQIRGKLDSITRLVGEHKKVTTQVGDLKTGTSHDESDLGVEIRLREAEFALLLAEWFTASFMRGNKNLARRKGAFVRREKHRNEAVYGRSRFCFRHFDKETGRMIFEEVIITPEQREEFNDWLDWYAQAVRTFRFEIKDYLKSIEHKKKRKKRKAKR